MTLARTTLPLALALSAAAVGPPAALAQGTPAPAAATLPAVGEGTVWQVDYIRTRQRKLQPCLQFYGANWARNREAAKRTGLVLSYHVWTSNPSGPDDWNVMLLTEYRNLAALDGLEEKYRPILAARTRVSVPDLDVPTDCVILASRTIRGVDFGATAAAGPR